MVKKASASSVHAGDKVTYTITVTNTGQVAFTATEPPSFTDDLTGVLDDATYDNDATGGATYAAPQLTWSGALPIAAMVTVTYSVTVNDPDRADGKLHNVVTIPTDPNGDPADWPVDGSDPSCGTTSSVEAAAATALQSGGTAGTGTTPPSSCCWPSCCSPRAGCSCWPGSAADAGPEVPARAVIVAVP